jgi:hypothetical protein
MNDFDQQTESEPVFRTLSVCCAWCAEAIALDARIIDDYPENFFEFFICKACRDKLTSGGGHYGQYIRIFQPFLRCKQRVSLYSFESQEQDEINEEFALLGYEGVDAIHIDPRDPAQREENPFVHIRFERPRKLVRFEPSGAGEE